MAAAVQITAPRAMWPPRPFLSNHSPRHAWGNSVSAAIRPMWGTATQAISDSTARMENDVANTSSNLRQS